MPGPPPRTTAALVQGIISTQTGFDVTPFITAANVIVNNILITLYGQQNPSAGGAAAYDDTGVGSTMELIERWLSAHLYTIFDNQLAAAKAGTVNVRYQWKTDLNLQASMYGQQVALLDYLGLISAVANTAKTKRVIVLKMEWLGRRHHHCDSPDWADITIVQ